MTRLFHRRPRRLARRLPRSRDQDAPLRTGPRRLRGGGRHQRLLGAVAADLRARKGGGQRRPGTRSPRPGRLSRSTPSTRDVTRASPTELIWTASPTARARPRPKRSNPRRNCCVRSTSTRQLPGGDSEMAGVDHDTTGKAADRGDARTGFPRLLVRSDDRPDGHRHR